jgi:hypothetical protein
MVILYPIIDIKPITQIILTITTASEDTITLNDLKNKNMICYFVSDQQSDYYNSKQFRNVLQFVQQHGNICKMKEKETKNGLRLLLTFENVKSINKALEYMEMI